MADATTTQPAAVLGTDELYEDDVISEAENVDQEPAAEEPPVADAPPPVDVPPPLDTPLAEAPPLPGEAAVPPPTQARAAQADKHPSFSELRALRKQLEERDAVISQLRQVGPVAAQPQAQAPQVPPQQVAAPDPVEDPIGYLQWQHAQVVQHQQWLAQQTQQIQQRQSANELQNMLNTQISDYSTRQPDYRDAAAFLQQKEINRWKALGYTDQEAMQQTEYRALQVVDAALRLGRSIPEALYEIALADGWTGNGNGASAISPVPEGVGAQTPAARVVASKAKSAATRTSMGSVAGTPSPGTRISRQQILSMSEEDLERTFGEGTAWTNLELEE
jgi:hypothetical protein